MANNEECKSNINNNTHKQLIGPDVTQLQEKIRTQAKRLCNFQEYISLCEKRLLQYNPQEQLPITKDLLSLSKANMSIAPTRMSPAVAVIAIFECKVRCLNILRFFDERLLITRSTSHHTI